jgi:preprotein translocase subunit SecF
MEFFHKVSTFPFMRTRKVWYVVSTLIIIASFVLLAVRGLNFGIDFTGGVVLEFAYPKAPNLEEVRATVAAAGFPEAQAQEFGGPTDISIRVPPADNEDFNVVSEKIATALRAVEPQVQLRRTEVVGPQVGEELTNQGGLAVLFTLVLIGIYTWFRFQWKLGVSAVAATLHDPVIILGFFAATQITFDLSVVAAVLAVIGYSLNDTVVVFDRLRENFYNMRKAAPTDILDASINQTLSRTIITSGATLLVVVVLLIFGGETLKGFSAALTIGIVVGTYSSIYVASAMALDMNINARDLMPVEKSASNMDALP